MPEDGRQGNTGRGAMAGERPGHASQIRRLADQREIDFDLRDDPISGDALGDREKMPAKNLVLRNSRLALAKRYQAEQQRVDVVASEVLGAVGVGSGRQK